MCPGGHCALLTAGMGAAAAGISDISSVAKVATGFSMPLHIRKRRYQHQDGEADDVSSFSSPSTDSAPQSVVRRPSAVMP